MRRSAPGPFLAVLAASAVAHADSVIPVSGTVDDVPPDHVLVPFDVPPGTQEIEVAHDDLSATNILDWGLLDPGGFRGWGGGNVEDAIVSELAASRSYLAGPIQPGTWYLVIGKAKIAAPPASYDVTITLRDAATLAPEPQRTPYVPAAPLEVGRRWYAGDFHVHSRESGDASPNIDAVAAFARSRGLDFVELSEHNTTSHDQLIVSYQASLTDFLLLPGIEVTTYDGHANAIGATEWVEHKIGYEGATIEATAQSVWDQDAVFSINHPALDLGDLCIGCAWGHPIAPGLVGGVEIQTGAYDQTGWIFLDYAMAFWDDVCDQGGRPAAIGGSDDHSGGQGMGMFDSPIGSPTTLVLADELSHDAIVRGVREGRTVVKLGGPDDPMLELRATGPDGTVAEIGDALEAGRVTLEATVTGGAGLQVRFVRNGANEAIFDVTTDNFTATYQMDVAETGDRVRAEVVMDQHAEVVTSHVWLTWAPLPPPPPAATGCGCRVVGGANGSALVGLIAAACLRRRRRGR